MTECSKCKKIVKDNCNAIQCDHCFSWYHLKCSNLSLKSFNHFIETEDLWLCNHCKSDIFPFYNISKNELLKLSFNSNTECQCSQRLINLQLDSLPQLDIFSSLDIPHLTDTNIDSQLPTQTNFNYYSTHDFYSSVEIQHPVIIFQFFTVISEVELLILISFPLCLVRSNFLFLSLVFLKLRLKLMKTA